MNDVFKKWGIVEESSQRQHLLRFTRTTPGTDTKLAALCSKCATYLECQQIILAEIGPKAPTEMVLCQMVAHISACSSRQDWVIKIRNAATELEIVQSLTGFNPHILGLATAALMPYSTVQRYRIETKLLSWTTSNQSSFVDKLIISLPNDWPTSLEHKLFQIDSTNRRAYSKPPPTINRNKRVGSPSSSSSSSSKVTKSGCAGCGGSCKNRLSCPAQGKTCSTCGTKHHFASVCRKGSKKTDRLMAITADTANANEKEKE
jgi:hypothetical protein